MPRTSPKKTRVLVVFGGRSGEHEVSLVSASSVIQALDPAKYQVTLAGITKSGKWICHPNALQLLKHSSQKLLDKFPRYAPGNPDRQELVRLPSPTDDDTVDDVENQPESLPVDVVFPVLHGTFGEDGAIQGMLDMAGIPYVGSGVLGSATGMDKIAMKMLCQSAGIPVTPYVWDLRSQIRRNPAGLINRAETAFGYPMFVKPANLGSSVGISKAHHRQELERALELAARYDRRILIEMSVERAREIELSVLGYDEPEVSVCGEVVPSNEFYDYEAKYVDGASELIIPATLTDDQRDQIQTIGKRLFILLDLAGLARVDFLVEKDGGQRIFLNEVNTMPGFTSISMYPRLWDASGLPYPQLLDRLIQIALDRHADRLNNATSVQTTDWYKQT